MRPRRLQALAVLTAFVTSLFAPVVAAAQGYEAGLSDESATYVSAVTERLTTKDALEAQWTRAQRRSQEIQAELRSLEQAQSQPGREASWYEEVSARMTKLKDDVSANDSILSRTRERLAKVYQQLDRDRTTVSTSQDPSVKQELGTLVGVAGSSIAAPIWTRPTAGQIGGMAVQAGRQVNLATVNARIPAYQNWATSAGTRAAGNEAALTAIKPGRWVPQGNGGSGAGELILRRHDILPDGSTGGYTSGSKGVKTGIPAKFQTADGTWVSNERGVVAANDLAALQNARTSLTNNINKLRLEASRATNNTVKTTLESRASALEGKKLELEGTIRQYNSNNPSFGQQIKTVGINAAKWAALSAGVTVATNVITQWAQTGKVDWASATAPLKDPHFWGGTAGSFIGSYGASIIASALPGGAFVKTLFAVGGAAIGWQAGSGQLGNTDWVRLGAGTMGATVGMLIGTALGGPIGAFIGGIVGQLAADFILNKVREAVIKEVAADTASGPGDHTTYGGDEGTWASSGSTDAGQTGYQGASPADTGYQSGYDSGSSSGSASDLAAQRAQVYQEMIQLQSEMKNDPQAFQQFVQKQREYDALTRQLHSMQRGGDIRQNR